jgi:Fe-S-cluster containining protein
MLAIRFNLTVGVFTRQYCEKRHGEYHLKHPEKDCLFLDANGRCSIYEDRPEQCRTWPFWPENFTAGRVRECAAKNCPGLQQMANKRSRPDTRPQV